jgi:hypothetical protein
MNKTTAPNAASAETEELLARLRANYKRRTETLEEIRRGVGHADRDAIILELVAFRGMQFTEVAEAMGYTREGVAKRIRPTMTELGLDGLTLIQRQSAKVTRPHRRASLDSLLAKLKPEHEQTVEKAATAERLRLEILADLDRLHAAGMSWVQLAARLDISVPTLQRLRGAM